MLPISELTILFLITVIWMNRAEELLKEIWDVSKSFNILAMTNYAWLDPSIYNVWKRRGVLPYRNVKKIVEYFEMHNDDVITLCWHLMDYYKDEEKKRNERVEETKERNRQRARERNARIRANKN